MSGSSITISGSEGEIVQGDKEIMRLLAALPESVGRALLIKSVSFGSTELVRGIRSEIPRPRRGTTKHAAPTKKNEDRTIGTLAVWRKRIGKSKVKTVRATGTAKVGVGVGRPRLQAGDPGGWLNVKATGTGMRSTKSGRSTGKIRGDRFVQRGAKKKILAAKRRMRKKGLELFKKETAKLAKRFGTRRAA